LIIQHSKKPSLKDAKFVPFILIKQDILMEPAHRRGVALLLSDGEQKSLAETPTAVGVSSLPINSFLGSFLKKHSFKEPPPSSVLFLR